MTEEVAYWVAARSGNSLILLEQNGHWNKLSRKSMKAGECSIIKPGRRIDLGKLLGVDLSPEALIEGVEIREGDRILLFPASSGIAE